MRSSQTFHVFATKEEYIIRAQCNKDEEWRKAAKARSITCAETLPPTIKRASCSSKIGQWEVTSPLQKQDTTDRLHKPDRHQWGVHEHLWTGRTTTGQARQWTCVLQMFHVLFSTHNQGSNCWQPQMLAHNQGHTRQQLLVSTTKDNNKQ